MKKNRRWMLDCQDLLNPSSLFTDLFADKEPFDYRKLASDMWNFGDELREEGKKLKGSEVKPILELNNARLKKGKTINCCLSLFERISNEYSNIGKEEKEILLYYLVEGVFLSGPYEQFNCGVFEGLFCSNYTYFYKNVKRDFGYKNSISCDKLNTYREYMMQTFILKSIQPCLVGNINKDKYFRQTQLLSQKFIDIIHQLEKPRGFYTGVFSKIFDFLSMDHNIKELADFVVKNLPEMTEGERGEIFMRIWTFDIQSDSQTI